MTDFVGRVLRPERDNWVIRSLLHIDFYKFTMGLFIYRYFRGVEVTFAFINRHLHIPLARIVDEIELRRQLDHARTLIIQHVDLFFLRSMDVFGYPMFPPDYLEFLMQLRLGTYKLERVGDQYRLTFTGPWEVVTFWETIALSIITELFYRTLMESMTETQLNVLFGRMYDKLYRKLERLATRPWIRFADFSTRRHFSRLWQRTAVIMAREMVPTQFTGTSNAQLARELDCTPIGTYAHELPIVVTALAPRAQRITAQYTVLPLWASLFPKGGLRITLPDTYGTKAFFKHMPPDLAEQVAREWRGFRDDSGDTIANGRQYVGWYAQFGINPKQDGKIMIPSDGLDVDPMFAIDDALRELIGLANGWGTNFGNGIEGCHPRPDDEAVVRGEKLGISNDVLFRGHSFICKPAFANNNPCVKISNNPNKATGDSYAVAEYTKDFGTEGHVAQDVLV